MGMLQNFLLALFSAIISAVALNYSLTEDYNGNIIQSSKLHWLFRIIVYPFYMFAFAYFYCLFFAITVKVPALFEVILGFIVGMILLWMDTPEWVGLILLIISDLIITPVLVFVFGYLVTLWDFGRDRNFTFYYRLFILIPITIFMVYVIVFRPFDFEWWDKVVFAGAIIFASAFSFIKMKEDKNTIKMNSFY